MENNFQLTGDEARILMNALMSSTSQAPTGMALTLYMRLLQISQVQPPILPEANDKKA